MYSYIELQRQELEKGESRNAFRVIVLNIGQWRDENRRKKVTSKI
jgi:hypothetical protein